MKESTIKDQYEDENEKMYSILEKYTEKLNAQNETLPIIMSALLMRYNVSSKKIDNLVKKGKIEIKEDKDGEKDISVPYENHNEFISVINETNISVQALKQTPTNLVVSLVCIYDAFIGNIIRCLYQIKPDLIKSCNIEFLSKDLLSFNTIEEIKEYIIDKETETVLRDNHINQLKWLENKIGVKLTVGEPHLSDFIEITERRNLFVHSEGRVSRQYINTCHPDKITLNSVLNADSDYITHCYNILFEIGVKLGQVIWRKMDIGLDKCDESLQNITYELLNNKQYKLAETLLDFATQKTTKHYDKQYELVFIINKALSLHLQDKQSDCLSILNEYDWSAYSIVYRLAKEVLSEQYDKAAILMVEIGDDNNYKKKYQEWPLFRKFRNTELFQNTFKSIFKEDFEYIEPQKTQFEDIINEAKLFIENIKEDKK